MGMLRIWNEVTNQWEVLRGAQGDPGPQGDPGERGEEGQSVVVRHVVDTALDLPTTGIVVGDGALVGTAAPYDLFVYTDDPPAWYNVGPITAGPKGDTGDPGPPGPPATLYGSGVATTAARSDHNHDGVYSPATHTHSATAITSGTLADARIPTMNASKITAGTFGVDRIPALDAGKIASGTLADARIPNLNASKITAGTLSVDRIPGMGAGKITSGTLADARIPNLNASKITAGVFLEARIPGLGASKITSGTLSKDRIPNMSITELFPNNATTNAGSSSMRVAPGNQHSVINTLGSGWGLHDTGMRQNTDELWAYVMIPGIGFCWIPANRI